MARNLKAIQIYDVLQSFLLCRITEATTVEGKIKMCKNGLHFWEVRLLEIVGDDLVATPTGVGWLFNQYARRHHTGGTPCGLSSG